MNSGTTRESEQVTITAYGCCPRSAVSSILDLETFGPSPERNLLLPSVRQANAYDALQVGPSMGYPMHRGYIPASGPVIPRIKSIVCFY